MIFCGTPWHAMVSAPRMSTFGDTLFGGSRFVRWSLTPVILCFALWLPVQMHEMTASKWLVIIGLEVVSAALLAGFWLPAWIGRWCFRVVTALVFLCYLWYLTSAFSAAHVGSRMKSLLGFLIIGLPSLCYTVLGRFSLRRAENEDELTAADAPDRSEIEASLLQPDWDFYEQHLQRPAPAALRALYADTPWITATLLDYSDECSINTFEPLNAQSQNPLLAEMNLNVIPIATSDFGDPIFLKPGSIESDAVYVTHHDGGDTEALADSVAGFVARLKRVNRPGE